MDPGDEQPQTSGRDGLLRVGCALLPKKVSRYLTPSIRATAREAGLDLVLIDHHQPLGTQGTFSAIIHKLPDKQWEVALQDYAQSHPECRIINSVEGVRTLRNRGTMLSVLHGDGVVMQPDVAAANGGAAAAVRVQAPVQVVVHEGMPTEEVERLLSASGMHPPLLVKPLWCDGREGSHELAVVHDLDSLAALLRGGGGGDGASAKGPTALRPPVVVQQFVEHGGVLHKVYVLGTTVVVCQRPSLNEHHLAAGLQGGRGGGGEGGGDGSGALRGIVQLPRISCSNSQTRLHGMDAAAPPPPPPPHHHHQQEGGAAELEVASPSTSPTSPDETCPPEWVTHGIAHTLRERLGVQLFNFDLIRMQGSGGHGHGNEGGQQGGQGAGDGAGAAGAAEAAGAAGIVGAAGAEEAGGPGGAAEATGGAGEDVYFIIDINHWPGVDKIPNFEHVFVQFLREACTREGGWATQ